MRKRQEFEKCKEKIFYYVNATYRRIAYLVRQIGEKNDEQQKNWPNRGLLQENTNVLHSPCLEFKKREKKASKKPILMLCVLPIAYAT